MSPVKPIPDGFHNITPYLYVKRAVAAIDFYKETFGATEIVRMRAPIEVRAYLFTSSRSRTSSGRMISNSPT